MLPVLTVATHHELGLGRFVTSCRRHGIDPLLLGYGRRWRGFGARLKLLRQALASLSGPVLFSDGYDVLLARDAEHILAAYREFGHPLVFGAETNCWPHPEWAGRHPESETPFRFLNGGGWIGEAAYVRDLLDRRGVSEIADDADDQAWWQELLFAEPDAIRLDTRQQVFGLLWGAEGDYAWDETGIRNERTGTRPCLLHGNGHADLSRMRTWLRLG